MKTLKADDRKRIQIPCAKPGQVFVYEDHGDGSVTLTAIKAERKEAFPKGSFTKYFTGTLGRERDELETLLAKGCVQGPE